MVFAYYDFTKFVCDVPKKSHDFYPSYDIGFTTEKREQEDRLQASWAASFHQPPTSPTLHKSVAKIVDTFGKLLQLWQVVAMILAGIGIRSEKVLRLFELESTLKHSDDQRC